MKNVKDIMKMSDQNVFDLKSNYQEALNNSKFRDYVKILNIPNEILMKYTSTLEDACLEFNNCSSCKALGMCKNQTKGFVLSPKRYNNTLNFEYVACPYMQKNLQENEYKKNIELFSAPKKIKEASLKSIHTDDKNRLEVIKYFKTFMDNYQDKVSPKGIYLHGSFGTGKSYMIAAFFNEFAKRNVHSVIIYFPEFLRSLKESFDSEYKEMFHQVKMAPLLLIDDIGAENLTPWARDEILGSILQYRMDEELPTFFTSNFNLEQLEEHLANTNNGIDRVKAKRIVERIKELTVKFELASKNRRNTND